MAARARLLAYVTLMAVAVLSVGSGYAQPANDDCADATVVSQFPFTQTLDTTAAGVESGEFPPFCGSSFRFDRSVWYRVVPPSDGALCVRSCNSGYPTITTVFDSCGGEEQQCESLLRCTDVSVSAGVSRLVRVDAAPGFAAGELELFIGYVGADGDTDGVSDCDEACSPGGDDDGDELSNCLDQCTGKDDRGDDDGDDARNCLDQCPGADDRTVPDCDGDGVLDCRDNCPVVRNRDQADGDGDGVGDLCDEGRPGLSGVSLFSLRETFHAGAPAEGDQFGLAVAVLDDAVLVGAPFTDVGAAIDAGRAYLFDGDTAGPLTANPGAGDRLGTAVTFRDGVPIVGAPLADIDASDGGVVLILRGGKLQRLDLPVLGGGARLGFSVAGLLGRLVAGAPGDRLVGLNAGAAVVGGTVVRASDVRTGDQFGTTVTIYDSGVLVGAPFDSAERETAGAVYVYDAQGGLQRVLRKPVPAASDLFGAAVAVAGGIVAVGVPFDDVAGADSGAVYLFDAETGASVGHLDMPDAAPGALFGRALAAIGPFIAVGAPGADSRQPRAGMVYLFNVSTGALVEAFVDPTPETGDRFGAAVALGAGAPPSVLVGAPSDDRDAPNAGVAYLFRACGEECERVCGNGIVEDGEECDDADAVNGDGCDENCTRSRCGNCVTGGDEQCDEPPDSLACRPDCTQAICDVSPPVAELTVQAEDDCPQDCSSCGNEGVCCDDGNVCTTEDQCRQLTCVGQPVTCAPHQFTCMVGHCDPDVGGCVYEPDDSRCNDNTLCTLDKCDPQRGCVFTAIPDCCSANTDCSNADVCDGEETCRPCLGCQVYRWACCDVGAQCVSGQPRPDGAPCEDGNVCTQADTCVDEHCKSGSAMSCADDDACTLNERCIPPTIGCESDTAPLCKACAGDTDCDDGRACDGAELCEDGFCRDSAPPVCDDHNACTADSCQESARGCVFDPSTDARFRCALDAALAMRCTADEVPGLVRSRFETAAQLLGNALVSDPPKKSLLRGVKKTLKKARRTATKEKRHGNISAACKADLVAGIRTAKQLLKDLQ